MIIRVIFYSSMKRNHVKTSRNCRTKVQLNIKSKNVTNNFILTPRTASALEQREHITKLDRLTEELRAQRIKNQEGLQPKTSRESRKHQYRIVNTDHPKINGRKRFQEEETGTHTPLLKRVSLNSETGKKKTDHSLVTSQKMRRRKPSVKPSNTESAELTKAMMQRLIGVIIKDYKEGRLKQKQLEQTLLEIYDRRQKQRTVSKKTKKKESGSGTFSNQFLRSNRNSKAIAGSEVLVRKKPKMEQIEIHESVLERKGFVNKIIIKGITTSLFLREDQTTNGKESDVRARQRESHYQIITSNSVQEINEDMKNIQNMYRQKCQSNKYDLKEQMAIRIQRAWRKYKTRQIVKKISSKRVELQHPFHILDQFTDQEVEVEDKDEQLLLGLSGQQYFSSEKQRQYDNLVKLVSLSLQQKDISKEECLKKILSYLNFPEEYETIKKIDDRKQKDESVCSEQKSQYQSSIERLPDSQAQHHKMKTSISVLKVNKVEMIGNAQINEGLNTQQRSFTNKYPSEEVKQRQQDVKSFNLSVDQLDQSLTYAHSQTLAHESFKSINILNIEEGLSGREEALVVRKDRQIEMITDKLFNNKVTKQDYLIQKSKIEKWFKTQQKQLKKIKNSLLKSCIEAKKLLDGLNMPLKLEKSRKMMKCLSDKYINRHNWLTRNDEEPQEKVEKKKHKKIHCQEREEMPVKPTPTQYEDEDEFDQRQMFNKLNQFEVNLQKPALEITPKLARHQKIEENSYKYQQIAKTIDEEECSEQEILGKSETISHLSSEKVIDPSTQTELDIELVEISLINSFVEENSRRLKYLCPEDKEDIFEFLFLDLALEIFSDTYPGQERIHKAASAYINKVKRLKKIPKGIKNGLPYCKDYLKFLSTYLLNTPKSLKNLSVPMGPTAVEMLRYMRDQYVETEEENIDASLVLPIGVFQKISRSPAFELKIQRYYDDEEREQSRLNFLKTVQHINNKALFDSLNEMLDHERPYGVWGKPFPWKKMLSVDRKWGKEQQEQKLKKSVEKTIESCSYMCGILADKQDNLFGNHRVSEEYVTQIREDRLSKMLSNELFENDQRWTFYDDEEAEILMEVSSYIMRRLIKETVLQTVNYRMRM